MKTVMVFGGDSPHPSHNVFVRNLNCDLRHFETLQTPADSPKNTGQIPHRIRSGLALNGYDTVIAEGTAPLQTALVSGFVHDLRVVYLCADQTFMTLPERQSEVIWELIPDIVDLTVAVSEVAWNWASPYIDSDVKIVRPAISQEKYERLLSIEPTSPNDGYILCVSKPRPQKQLGNLGEIADEVDMDVKIVGEHGDKEWTNHPRVESTGWLDIAEFVDVHRNASVYVHPSSGDANPVATMESMLAGTPTIVTPSTGTHEIGAISCPLNQMADQIQTLMNSNKAAIGAYQRESVSRYTESRQAKRFAEVVR